MAEELNGEERAAYLALMRVVLAAPRVLSADIAGDSGLGISHHLVLETIAKAADRQLRVGEIAAACGITLSGASRIMDRLVEEGLIRRLRSAGDGRGAVAALTETGQTCLDVTRAAHFASVRRWITGPLGRADLACVTAGMERVADSLKGRPE